MFWHPAHRMRDWLTGAGDRLLGFHDELGVVAQPSERPMTIVDYHALHPHRQDLRWQRERRPGSVPARPAFCLSPIRREPARRPITFP